MGGSRARSETVRFFERLRSAAMGPEGSSSAEDRLRSLEAVTDAALDWLGLDDLLDELLERICPIVEADTAAVLLVDDSTGELVARAARGVEEEVEQGFRVPLGQGFAGRVAQTRQPVRLDRVDPTTVINPLLWEKGIRVMLGVPLLGNGVVLGVLHVGRLEEHPFSERDAEVLQVVARWIASAVQARQLASEREASLVLERSLRPGRFPHCPGLQLASRYLPADNRIAGGDWYDVFRLPSGELWIVTADVAGHGLEAAVVMGRVRSALRSYALLDVPPAEVLELTDRKVQHFEIGSMITVLCATAQEPYDHLEVVSAGHLPSVLALPGQPATLLDIEPDPPLGTVAGVRRKSTTVAFPPGALLLTYTDGLVERRTEPLEADLERLRSLVRADHPEVVCAEAVRALRTVSDTDDDVAMVAVRRLPD